MTQKQTDTTLNNRERDLAILKSFVRAFYDIQDGRLRVGGRIVSNFKIKLGQKPSGKEKDIDPEDQRIMGKIRKSHKLLAQTLSIGLFDDHVKFPKKFPGDGIIDSQTEFFLMQQFMRQLNVEERQKTQIQKMLNQLNIPVYDQYLKDVRGIGPIMAGVIITGFDIHKAKYASSLWKYCGLDVVIDPETGKGVGRSRQKAHLIDVEYIDKHGKTKTKKSLTYNPFMKRKMAEVLASSFIRSKNEKYYTIYCNYKHRMKNHPEYKDEAPARHDRQAKRYMIKIFIVDLYENWRRTEGLPVYKPYADSKLGIVHKRQ